MDTEYLVYISRSGEPGNEAIAAVHMRAVNERALRAGGENDCIFWWVHACSWPSQDLPLCYADGKRASNVTNSLTHAELAVMPEIIQAIEEIDWL